jgi:sec-independent protein translocase protein TatA
MGSVADGVLFPLPGGNTMGELLTPTHLLIVAIVAIVLFGGKKLPELGKGLGEGLRGFKEGVKGVTDEVKDARPGDSAHTVTPKADDTTKPAA